jgi:hypothetical protein
MDGCPAAEPLLMIDDLIIVVFDRAKHVGRYVRRARAHNTVIAVGFL